MAGIVNQQQLEDMWLSDFGARYPNSYSYFSGSQIVIYIGDVLLEEAVFLSYQEQQNKKPIFGYASQYWDAVAQGTSIVQGSLAINYIDNKYLPMLIFDTLNRKSSTELAAPPANPRPLDQMSFMAQAAGYNVLTDAGKQNFDAMMNTQKNKYWQPIQSFRDMPGAAKMDPVDIFLTYGNQTGGSMGSTSKRLIKTVFTEESQTIEINGQPVLEVYQFLSQRIINELSRPVPSQTTKTT